MLCQKCKINNANVKIIRNINGDVKEMYLCSSCADSEGLSLKKQLQSDFFSDPFFNFLAPETTTELTCPRCGTKYYQFKEGGKFGCEDCFETFSKMLAPMFKNIHGATEHTGKFPKHSGGKFLKEKKIENLRVKLDKAIKEENFELAAKLRDEIRASEGGNGNV